MLNWKQSDSIHHCTPRARSKGSESWSKSSSLTPSALSDSSILLLTSLLFDTNWWRLKPPLLHICFTSEMSVTASSIEGTDWRPFECSFISLNSSETFQPCTKCVVRQIHYCLPPRKAVQFSVIYVLFPTFQPLNCKNLSLPKLAIHKLYIKTNSKRERFSRELFWLLQKPFWAIWTDSCDRYCKKIQICQFICVLVHVITVGNRRFDWQIRDKVPVVQTLDSAIHRINHYPADKY